MARLRTARPRRQPDPAGPESGPLTGDQPVATLGQVVDQVGPEILEVVAAPQGVEVTVDQVVLHDPCEALAADQADIVLAIGSPPGERSTMELVRQAAAAGAAAVVVKATPGAVPAGLRDEASTTGIALLAVAPEMAWGQLHTLLRTARTAAGLVGEPPPGGAPIGDLFGLANAVAAMVGGPTTIEDPQSTVLAYSSLDEPIDEPRRQTILGRRVPGPWVKRLRADGVFSRLWSGEVVRVDYTETDDDFHPRLAVAVRAGGEVLGSIWVAEGTRPLDAEAESALREAARLAALHLLRHRSGDDLERRRRSEQLRAALDGRLAPELLATSLDFPAGSVVTVIGFELQLPDASDLADLGASADRAVGVIALHCGSYRRQAACVASGRVVYVLLPDSSPPDRDRLRTFAHSVVDRAEEVLGTGGRAAIAATVALPDLLRARQEVDRILRAASGTEAGLVVGLEDIQARVLMLELKELVARHPQLRLAKVDELVRRDQGGQTNYVATLRAHLDAFGDIPSGAAALGVHPNTFRYRLRRLCELVGLDLSDPVERLAVQLQLAFVED